MIPCCWSTSFGCILSITSGPSPPRPLASSASATRTKPMTWRSARYFKENFACRITNRPLSCRPRSPSRRTSFVLRTPTSLFPSTGPRCPKFRRAYFLSDALPLLIVRLSPCRASVKLGSSPMATHTPWLPPKVPVSRSWHYTFAIATFPCCRLLVPFLLGTTVGPCCGP